MQMRARTRRAGCAWTAPPSPRGCWSRRAAARPATRIAAAWRAGRCARELLLSLSLPWAPDLSRVGGRVHTAAVRWWCAGEALSLLPGRPTGLVRKKEVPHIHFASTRQTKRRVTVESVSTTTTTLHSPIHSHLHALIHPLSHTHPSLASLTHSPTPHSHLPSVRAWVRGDGDVMFAVHAGSTRCRRWTTPPWRSVWCAADAFIGWWCPGSNFREVGQSAPREQQEMKDFCERLSALSGAEI